MVLCWVLLFLKPSNAELVTVPLENGLSVTVSTGTTAPALQNLYTNPLATDITMGDDSNQRVPLQFQFPFYGKTFTESWMYSNGAISFTGSNAPGGFCCNGQDLTQLRDPAYNYSIVPLWTDLIAVQGGKHYTLGTPSSQTYGWYGVSEYFDPTKRSSFEVTINSSGYVNTAFSGALVSYHPVTSGMIGDITKGEYYQNYYGNGISSGPFSWSATTSVYDPCKDNPLATPSCSGFLEAAAALLPPTVAETVQTIAESAAVPDSASSVVAAISSLPVVSASTLVVTASPVSTQTSKPGVSLSQVLRIVGAEQSRLANVERSAAQSATDQATKLGEQARTTAETVALASTLSSYAQSSLGNSVVNTTKSTQQDTSANTTNTGNNQFNVGSTATAKANLVTEAEVTQQESVTFSGRSVITDYLTESNLKLSSMQETTQITNSARVSGSNSLAAGIEITSIAVIPTGYSAYTIQLTDSKFYDPKDIYKGQQTVDNIRVLRGLGSDQKHREMIQSQYR